jgi:hypothetical protein
MDNEEVGGETRPEESAGELSSQDSGVEKQLKDTKAKLTQVTQERAEESRAMTERIARLEGQLSAMSAPKETQADDPLKFLDDEDLREKFFEDADKPISAMKTLAKVIGNAMVARDQYWREELDKVRTALDRPEPSVVEKVAELKADPDFAGLDNKALMVFAKRMLKEPEAEGGYKGGPGGGSRVNRGSGNSAELETMVGKLLKQHGYK